MSKVNKVVSVGCAAKTKVKYCIVVSIFLCLAICGITITSIKPAKADTSSANFPVDEAGIAAYVKLDSVENIDIATLAEAYKSIEKQGESYVVGIVPVTNDPHVYIGLDGWIVAYFLKTEEASRIAGGTKATTLEDAIDYMAGQIGATYSTPVKYYDFEFPEANKITLITKDTGGFYVTVPGTLYEGSYRLYGKVCSGFYPALVKITVDEITVYEYNYHGWFTCAGVYAYGYFDLLTYFKAGVTHYIYSGGYTEGPLEIVLIYKN